MAQESGLWPTNGVGDGLVGGYPADDIAEWKRGIWLNATAIQGVGLGWNAELEITNPAGLNLSMDLGGGIVFGYIYNNTAAVAIALVLPIINTTGWRWVLRADWAAQTVRAVLLQSADGVAAIPAVTQVAGVTWEISLAFGTITVGAAIAITDDRNYLQPSILIDNSNMETRAMEFLVPAVECITGGAHVVRTSHRGWPCATGILTECLGGFRVPPDIDLGNVFRVAPLYQVDATTATNISLSNFSAFGNVGEDWDNTLVSLIGVVFGSGIIDIIQAPGGLQLELQPTADTLDWVSLSFTRNGNVGGDTFAGTLYFMGWRVIYDRDH